MFLILALALWSGASDAVGVGSYWAGIVVALVGVVLAGDGVFRIRSHITALPAPVAGAPLVEEGSFRLARHPIYGGLVIAAFGFSIARGSIAGIAATVVLAVFFMLKSRHEEVRLEEAYPGYADYRVRVPRRMVPWVL
jgi:protein-S-isoprenylcysteine O-methyltransferase Ste14